MRQGMVRDLTADEQSRFGGGGHLLVHLRTRDDMPACDPTFAGIARLANPVPVPGLTGRSEGALALTRVGSKVTCPECLEWVHA